MVLSGGGAKAAAHLGAARALREAGLTPTRWIGTSGGAMVAAGLATGEDPDAILERFRALRRSDFLVRDWPALLRGVWARAVLKPEPVRRLIARLVPVHRFEDLATPCTVTAVEVETGREVAFGHGGENAPLHDALAASCALPPYFPPVTVNGRAFYDGGLRAVVPLHLVEREACDFVVAIHAGPGLDEQGTPLEVPPPLLAAADTGLGWSMAGSVELARRCWELTPGAPPLVWLRPVSDRGATFAFDRVAPYAEAGYRAMHDALKELQ
jgi:NTE family protein